MIFCFVLNNHTATHNNIKITFVHSQKPTFCVCFSGGVNCDTCAAALVSVATLSFTIDPLIYTYYIKKYRQATLAMFGLYKEPDSSSSGGPNEKKGVTMV